MAFLLGLTVLNPYTLTHPHTHIQASYHDALWSIRATAGLLKLRWNGTRE